MAMFLKKLISRFCFPLPIGIELLVLGLILWHLTRHQKLGKGLVIASGVWMALIGYPFLHEFMLPGLTRQFPPQTAAQIQTANPSFIGVPGMGVSDETGYPANLRFPTEFILRLLEAVRIHRLCPDSQILMSVSNTNMNELEKIQATAELMGILGVDMKHVTVLTGLGDTEEEVMEFQRRSGGKAVCLVSSAANMPRSMLFARRYGLNAIACPSSPGGIPRPPDLTREFSIVDFFPKAENLGATELAFYEHLGLVLERVKQLSGMRASDPPKK